MSWTKEKKMSLLRFPEFLHTKFKTSSSAFTDITTDKRECLSRVRLTKCFVRKTPQWERDRGRCVAEDSCTCSMGEELHVCASVYALGRLTVDEGLHKNKMIISCMVNSRPVRLDSKNHMKATCVSFSETQQAWGFWIRCIQSNVPQEWDRL